MHPIQENITPLLLRDPALGGLRNMLMWAVTRKASCITIELEGEYAYTQALVWIDGKHFVLPEFKFPTADLHRALTTEWEATQVHEPAVGHTRHVALDIEDENGQRVQHLEWSHVVCRLDLLCQFRLVNTGEIGHSLQDLGFTDHQVAVIRRAVERNEGLTVFSSNYQQGKSTTLRRVNDTFLKHSSFTANGAGKPPMVLDKIRGADGVSWLKQAVMRGHAVFTSINSTSALGTVSDLWGRSHGLHPMTLGYRKSVGQPDFLNLAVYQRLLPRNCPHCSQSPDDYVRAVELSGKQLDVHTTWINKLGDAFRIDPSLFRLRNPYGCPHCQDEHVPQLNGYCGQTAVAEMVEFDDAMRAMIARCAERDVHQYWHAQGSGNSQDPNLTGKSIHQCAILKSSQGLIDPRELHMLIPDGLGCVPQAAQAVETLQNMVDDHSYSFDPLETA